MVKEFSQLRRNEQLEQDALALVQLAVREDLDRLYDWTTAAVVDDRLRATARLVAREAGTLAGIPAAQLAYREFDRDGQWTVLKNDGDEVAAGDVIAELRGDARHLLTAERLVLNILSRLTGIATQTRRYVDCVANTAARIYDTRKTTPGWRRLEKYAVRQGGGHNHRTGLFDAILIKDNHLAFAGAAQGSASPLSPSAAVKAARDFVEKMLPAGSREAFIVEIEVDTLEQLDDALTARPDIVLLDNMPPETLRAAVARRDAAAPGVELEASGGVTLASVAAIAATGVERISAGALTHAATWLDIGLDWATDSAD